MLKLTKYINLFLIQIREMDIIPQFSQLIHDLDSVDQKILSDKVIKINMLLESYTNDFQKLGNAMLRLCEKIMKIKNVHNQCVEYYENIICQVIRITINNQFRVGFDALGYVFNPNSDFYKSAHLDISLNYPIGPDRPLQQYIPEIGQQCDNVKPYITSTGFCGWNRCIVLENENNKCTIKYANSNNPNTVRQKPWFAPLGSRTQDFQWRNSLQIGAHIQALLNRVWYKATVVEANEQNGAKKVRVTYRRFDQKGDREDSQGNKYFGLSINEDEWLEVLSPRIQMCGKMAHKKLCYYTFHSEQILPQDSYDMLFEKEYKEKPFYAIMRIVNCKSLSLIKFIHQFIQHKGIQRVLSVMNNPEFSDQIIFTVLTHIGVMVPFFPQMFTREKILFDLYERIFDYFRETSKFLNPPKIDRGYFCYDILGRRLYSLSEIYVHQNQLKKNLIKQFLKMNMQKQMLALRYINDLINPKKPYTFAERDAVDKFLRDQTVFTQIFNLNTHQQIISRSGTLLQYLIQKQIITQKQFESLWKIVPVTDTRGRAMIERLLAQISKNIPMSYVNFLISKILSLKQTELTADNLNLLRELKNRNIGEQNQLKILTFLWDILTVKSINIKASIQQEAEKVFKALISTIKDPKIRMNLLQSMSQKLQQCKKIKSEIQLLKDFIKTYPQKSELSKQNSDSNQQNYPVTIFNVVSFLKTKNIYEGLLALLFKSKQEEAKKDLFNFFQFLFTYDSEDINPIIKHVYDQLGPSVNFLQWVLKLMPRSINFATDLLQNTEDFSSFEKISLAGYEALQSVILLTNSLNKNIKMIKTHQYNASSSVFSVDKRRRERQGSSSNIIELKYYIYVLVSPFKIIGIKFLQHLLQIVKESPVYNAIIKIIIHLMSSLDESIEANTLKYRKEFLEDIIKQIKNIVEQGKCNQKIKSKLQVYINLLTEIFGETQKNGIEKIEPHFQKVEGEKITLNIQNLFVKKNKSNGSLSSFKVICNQNSTIWRLKKIIGQIINEKAQNIDIYKHIDPLSDTTNGKSLVQLLFYDNENIKIDKKKSKYIPKSNLLNEDASDVSEKFQKIIKIIFEQFKNKEVEGLSFAEVEKLSNQRWKNSFFKQKQNIEKILEEHDKDKKGYLNYSDFKQFFYKKSIKNQSMVWRIINLSGFKNDFSHSSADIEERNAENNPLVEQNAQTLPRRILSCPQVYNLIFSIFEKQQFKQVHLSFYRLLTLLEVNKDLHRQIETNIYSIIKQQKSVFTLCYIIQVALAQLIKKQEFYFSFWEKNGVQIIQERIYQFLRDQKPIHQMQTLVKMLIIPTFVKILNLYASQLLSDNRVVRFITNNRINLLEPTEFVKKYKECREPEANQKIEKQAKDRLKQKGQIENILRSMFDLANKIFQNLLLNYNQMLAYLQKLVIEVVRLFGCLIISNKNNHNFSPVEFLKGIKNGDLNCRRSSVIFIYLYIFYSEKTSQQEIEQILSKMLEQMPYENKSENYNYFSLLNQIISKYEEINRDNKQKNQYFISLANSLLDKLFSQVLSQNRAALVSSKIVLGILINIDSLLQRDSTKRALCHRKKQIIQKCLFAYNIQAKLNQLEVSSQMLLSKKQNQHFKNYVICKTDETRRVVYNIIIKLHEISYIQGEDLLVNCILPVLRSISLDVRVTDQRELDVGLKNFGSTCYMNSMLQVLNSVSPFRNILMKCETSAPLISQLKRLFAALYFSERRDYAPGKLLQSFNPPINPGIQQDTTQFLNLLFDQLEVDLSKTKYPRILDEIFKGSTTVQMICHSCGYKKENKQQFFSFGVQIQGKTDLQAALEGSYQGQVISDYLCDQCKNRGQTTKRNLLSEIPSILFIHLRRIVFNYDMFVNMKIHSRLKFPQELNIEPYTKQGVQLRQKFGLEYLKSLSHNQQQLKKFNELAEHGRQKDYYKLKLKGIIVHSGSADVGHYYSILSNQKTWRKYDDSRVTSFGYNGFESQCYGGNFIPDEWGAGGTSKNAYVLVYEKVVKNSITMAQENGNEHVNYDKVQVYNSSEDYKQLWLDNHNFMLESQLLNSKQGRDFISFTCQLMKIQKNCRMSIEIISQVIYRISYHSGLIGELLMLLKEHMNEVTPQIFYKYVMIDKVRTFKLLFSHERALRDFMANYLEIVLINSFAKGDDKVKLDILSFIIQYLNALTGEVAKNWARIDGYFKLLFLLVLDSTKFRQIWQLFISRNLISTLIDFVLQKQSPVKINNKSYSLGTKTNPMDFSFAIGVISFLVKHTYGFTGKNYELTQIPEQFIFHLNDNDVFCLSSMDFYQKMIRERQNLPQLAAIIHRLCIQNLQFSQAICRVILQAINFITDSKDQMQDLCVICFQILKINDRYWINRAQMLLGNGFPSVLNENLMTNFQQETFVYLSTICDIFPTQCLFEYIYVNHPKNTLACFQLARIILQSCSISQQSIKFITRQPSPSYMFDSLLSWFENFIQNFISSVLVQPKHKERLQLQISGTLKYIEDLNKYIENNPDVDFYQSVITGQIGNKKQVELIQKQGIQVKLHEYQVYCLKSNVLKNGGNSALEKYLEHNRLTKPVTKDSNILKFFKNPSKAITLKLQPVEQDEDKQIVSLFDDDPYPVLNPKLEVPKSKKKIEVNNQNIMQEGQSAKQTQINIDGIFTNNYIREVFIFNNSKDKRVVRILFDCEGNPNCNIPKVYTCKVMPKSNESLWLSKQNVNKDWGNIKLVIQTQVYAKQKHEKGNTRNWFKIYKQQSNRVIQQTVVEKVDIIQKSKEEEQKQNLVDTTQNTVEQFGKNCPACTFFNSFMNTQCQICGSTLQQ